MNNGTTQLTAEIALWNQQWEIAYDYICQLTKDSNERIDSLEKDVSRLSGEHKGTARLTLEQLGLLLDLLQRLYRNLDAHDIRFDDVVEIAEGWLAAAIKEAQGE